MRNFFQRLLSRNFKDPLFELKDGPLLPELELSKPKVKVEILEMLSELKRAQDFSKTFQLPVPETLKILEISKTGLFDVLDELIAEGKITLSVAANFISVYYEISISRDNMTRVFRHLVPTFQAREEAVRSVKRAKREAETAAQAQESVSQ